MKIGERLAAEMEVRGISEGELGRRSGVNQPTIHRIISGESKNPRQDNVERIAKALGVTSAWLWGGGQAKTENNIEPTLQPRREPKDYPLISWIAAGERAESPDNYHPGDGEERLESTENAGECGYWLAVKGQSMKSEGSPSFPDGIKILIKPEGFDLVNGKFYIAKHVDGETTFKQYVRDAGTAYLVPLNQAFKTIEMDDEWRIIGRVIDAKITGL